MAQVSTRQRQSSALAGQRHLPAAPELELEVLGAAILGDDVGHLEPGWFTGERRTVAEVINEYAGQVTASLVLARLPELGALVVEATSTAAFGKRLAASLVELANFAAKRQRALELSAELEQLAPLIVSSDGHANGNGSARSRATSEPASFPGEVLQARSNGKTQFRLSHGGLENWVPLEALVGDGTQSFGLFPTLAGWAKRSVREDWANDVIARGAAIMEYPEHCEGAAETAPGAGVEGWDEILTELERAPKLALYVAGGLGSYLLGQAGMGFRLRPLGFCLHAVGDERGGKNTAQETAAATVGNPALADKGGMVRCWDGSANGLRLAAADAAPYPLVITELSTYAGKRSELQRTVMALFEGGRTLSSRDGRLITRARAYEGVMLSSGNEGICEGGPPALRARALELPTPLTVDEAQSDRLRELIAAHYGWPLQQLKQDHFDAEVFAANVDKVARDLLRDEDRPTVRDAARRCAVVVAAAAVLGELVGIGHAVAMTDAALEGAQLLLEALRGKLADEGPCAADRLLAAMWTLYARRPAEFPLHGTEPEHGVRAKGSSLEGRLLVFPADMHQGAAEAGLRDAMPALRELRRRGDLTTQEDDCLTNVRWYFGRRLRVYEFGPPPEAEEPPPGAENSQRAGQRAGWPARETVAVASQDDPTRGTRGQNRTRALKQHISPAVLARASLLVGGCTVELPHERLSLEGLAAVAGELGAEVVLVPAEARERLLGVPSGWRHDVGGVVVVDLAQDQGGVCWPLSQVATAAELAAGLEQFAATVGHPWHSSPGQTFERLALATHPPERGGRRLDVSGVPDIATQALEVPHDWRRELTEQERSCTYVHGYDVHGQYLAAWSSLELPFGTPVLVKGPVPFDPSVSGLWHLSDMSGLSREMSEMSVLSPPVVGGRHGWVTTPTLQFCAEVLGEVAPADEAWVWPEHSRYLAGLYAVLRDARSALMADPSPGAALALSMLKRVYQVGTGRLGMAEREGRWARPHWAHFVRAKARSNLDRRLRKLSAMPFAIAVDACYFATDEADPARFAADVGLPLGDGLGQFSVISSAPLTAELLSTIERAKFGSSVAEVV